MLGHRWSCHQEGVPTPFNIHILPAPAKQARATNSLQPNGCSRGFSQLRVTLKALQGQQGMLTPEGKLRHSYVLPSLHHEKRAGRPNSSPY